jgi:hypothetical protein
MNQSKFSLADLLIVLGTLGFGFFCFLSFNFLMLGDTLPSLFLAALIAIILGGLALGAKILKRTSQNFKTCIILEWVLLFLFILIAIVAIFPFSHYFTVSEQKTEIKNKLISNITQAQGIFSAYEIYADNRLSIYENRLKGIVTARNVNPTEFKNFGFIDGVNINRQVENKLRSLKFQLYPSNYKAIKQIDSAWISDSKTKITNWSPIGIVKVMNSLKTEIPSWIIQLKTFSAFKAYGENVPDDFNYNITFNNVTNKFTTRSNPNALSICIAIAFYVLMLLSYFITKRHSKYPGLKLIFGKGNLDDNEL